MDVHICPGGQTLSPSGKPQLKNGTRRQRYQSQEKRCAECPLRGACLPQKTPVRQIYRSEHADALERHRQRMAGATDKMRQRAAISEHPFGTMKRWLGWDHFLVRGFEKVRGEMALLVHGYNLKRVLTIFGVERFIAICAARRNGAPMENDNILFYIVFMQRIARSRRPWRRFSPSADSCRTNDRTRRRRLSARTRRRRRHPGAQIARL